jgi:hypothetical protein
LGDRLRSAGASPVMISKTGLSLKAT